MVQNANQLRLVFQIRSLSPLFTRFIRTILSGGETSPDFERTINSFALENGGPSGRVYSQLRTWNPQKIEVPAVRLRGGGLNKQWKNLEA